MVWDTKKYYQEHKSQYLGYREKNRQRATERAKLWFHSVKNDPYWKQKILDWTIKSRMKRKIDLYNLYKGKCAHCECRDIRVLQLDHIHNNGAAHRKKMSSTVLITALLRGKIDKSDYQLLCANCNWIKRLHMPDVTTLELLNKIAN